MKTFNQIREETDLSDAGQYTVYRVNVPGHKHHGKYGFSQRTPRDLKQKDGGYPWDHSYSRQEYHTTAKDAAKAAKQHAGKRKHKIVFRDK